METCTVRRQNDNVTKSRVTYVRGRTGGRSNGSESAEDRCSRPSPPPDIYQSRADGRARGTVTKERRAANRYAVFFTVGRTGKRVFISRGIIAVMAVLADHHHPLDNNPSPYHIIKDPISEHERLHYFFVTRARVFYELERIRRFVFLENLNVSLKECN